MLESKGDTAARPAAVDQVQAYARDLAEYDQASHDLHVVPILVLTGTGAAGHDDEVIVVVPSDLARAVLASARPGLVELETWLEAPYAPLPTLVAAARRILQDEPLPAVKRALSSFVYPRPSSSSGGSRSRRASGGAGAGLRRRRAWARARRWPVCRGV